MNSRNNSLLILLLILFACEDRDRLNPLDPKNEVSYGAPTGTRIFSRRDTAIVSWKPFNVNNMRAYEVYRGIDENTMDSVGTVPADSTEYLDLGLVYYQPYYYAVKALTEFSQSQRSEPVMTTLGPSNLWVADMYSFILRNISFDGTQVQKKVIYTSPRSLAWDSNLELLWLGEYYRKKVYGLNRDLDIVKEIELPDNPIDIAMDSINQHVFVILRDTTLRAYESNGTLIWSYRLNNVPNFSTELAYDGITHSLWIAMNSSDRVLKIVVSSNAIDEEVFAPIPNPGPLAVDPLEGGVWVSTESGIARITGEGNVSWYKEDLFIYDVSVHPETGDCYYTGSREQFTAWETGFLPHADPNKSVVLLGNEVDRLYNIQVMPGNDPPGFFVQQAFTWKLLRYTGKGEKIGELENFNSRLDFILD